MSADPTGNVISALAAVMAEMPAIGRDMESSQGYAYRGIEAITAHLQPLLAKHGVVFVPRVVKRETKDFVLNQRPWTEEQAWIEYRVYGPGGVKDYVVVGPLVGLGRDNSDKGMNKAMTQAFKYALLQTFCIGDRADEPDAEVAHVPDEPLDPARQRRVDLSDLIRGLPEEVRAELRAFCDAEQIPRVPKEMTDEQVDKVEAFLAEPADEFEVGDSDSGAGPIDAPDETAKEAAQEAERLALHAASLRVQHLLRDLPTADTDKVVAYVRELHHQTVNKTLTELGVDHDGWSIDLRRMVLTASLLEAAQQERADLQTNGKD